MTLIQVKLQKDNVFQIAWIEKKTTVKKGYIQNNGGLL
jgi:hypothetical protein